MQTDGAGYNLSVFSGSYVFSHKEEPLEFTLSCFYT